MISGGFDIGVWRTITYRAQEFMGQSNDD